MNLHETQPNDKFYSEKQIKSEQTVKIKRLETENQQLREALQQCLSLIGNSSSAIDTVNPTELKTVWVVLDELLNSGKEK